MLQILKTLPNPQFSGSRWRTRVLAKCLRCGTESEYLQQNVKKHNKLGRGHCSTCVVENYHNLTGTRIWRIWQGMRWRAKDVTDKNYGGRGIDVCQEWQSFNRFYEDMSPGYSDDLTIERIDVNQPYSKANCRWASNMEQQANKRNNRRVVFNGEPMHLAELVRRSGISKMMLSMRLNRGMTADEAVADARASRYGKGPRAKKGRMSSTSLTAARGTDS
jgi:hypothetical protein